jgi:hypothetical protein
MLVEAALILIPQPMATLGAEPAAINLLGLEFHLSNLHTFSYKNKEMGNREGFSVAISFIVSPRTNPVPEHVA